MTYSSGSTAICTASILSAHVAITAGHCVIDVQNGTSVVSAELLTAASPSSRAGRFDDAEASEVREEEETSSTSHVSVSDMVPHVVRAALVPSEFDLRIGLSADLGLVYVDSPTDVKGGGVLIAKKNDSRYPAHGALIGAAGFGETDEGGGASLTINEVHLRLGAFNECAVVEPEIVKPLLSEETMVCATAPGFPHTAGASTCKGDSGGPIFVLPGDGEDERMVQIGVTSFSTYDCGEAGGQSWYVDLRAYAERIGGALNDNFEGWRAEFVNYPSQMLQSSEMAS